jgi:Domain of unknown function (DUF5916)
LGNSQIYAVLKAKLFFMKLSFYGLLISLCAIQFGFAQTKNELKYRHHIKKASGSIKIDGELDEADWKKADVMGNYWQQFPYDTLPAKMQTETRLTFDDTYIYVAFVVYQPRKYAVQSLKRDFPHGGGTDLVLINFDTFKDKQNGFHFAVNPYGVQREGLISNGEEVTNDWDNKWFTEAKNYDDRWVVEVAIPFKSIRYRVTEGVNEWNVNTFRNNLYINERSAWAPIPRGFRGTALAFSGTLVWDTPPPRPGSNISLIPYILGGISKDYIKETAVANEKNIGFDAKVAITPSLNLDMTVNPDFAQVDVDQQVTNLSRFELFFPERRQFFLENADLFGTFGLQRVNPFFTRRIGLAKNKAGDNILNRIVGGARLSGKLNNNWRVGLMDIQTANDESNGIKANNFLVAAVQRRLFTRSNISALVVNRQGAGIDNYNRLAGLDYNMASKDGFWRGKIFHHQLFTPQRLDEQYAQGMRLERNTPKFGLEFQLENVGINFAPEVGYVPRKGYYRNASNFVFTHFPKGKLRKFINSIGIQPDWDLIWGKTENRWLDRDMGLFTEIRFQDNSMLNFSLARWDYTYLFADFDPSGKGDTKNVLKAGTEYWFFNNRFFFGTNNARRFSVMGRGRVGKYFNGNIFDIGSTINYRYQPFFLMALGVHYSRVRMPKPLNSNDLWLISPRIDLTFSRSVFWTTFLQYNNQTNNMNINTRLQWRFKPASDMFIVYTDNYFTENTFSAENRYYNAFQSKNRSLVLKLTYWFNV